MAICDLLLASSQAPLQVSCSPVWTSNLPVLIKHAAGNGVGIRTSAFDPLSDWPQELRFTDEDGVPAIGIPRRCRRYVIWLV